MARLNFLRAEPGYPGRGDAKPDRDRQTVKDFPPVLSQTLVEGLGDVLGKALVFVGLPCVALD